MTNNLFESLGVFAGRYYLKYFVQNENISHNCCHENYCYCSKSAYVSVSAPFTVFVFLFNTV